MPKTTLPIADIILTTLNSRYIHCAFGLRYLYANLGDLQTITSLDEFTIHERPLDIAEKLLNKQPNIIGFSVYIWNIAEITQTIAMLKQIAPQVIIVLGGPEVSYESNQQEIVALADYVITKQADVSFAQLCQQLLTGKKPLNKIMDCLLYTSPSPRD